MRAKFQKLAYECGKLAIWWNVKMVVHIVKYSMPDLRVSYILSEAYRESQSAITAQTRKCTKTYNALNKLKIFILLTNLICHYNDFRW